MHHVEALRFFLACEIVYFHLLHNVLISRSPVKAAYAKLEAGSAWGGLAVEGFLIMGGWFLFQSAVRSKARSFVEFALSRFFRLWPVMAFYTIVHLLFFRLDWENAFCFASFLHCTGLSLSSIGIIWYVAPFFWAGLFIAALLRRFDLGISSLVLALIVWFGYSANVNLLHGGLGRAVVWSWCSLAVVRVAAGLSLGVLLAAAADCFRAATSGSTAGGGHSVVSRLCWTVVEIALLAFVVKLLVVDRTPFKNDMVFVVAFSAFFLVFATGKGFLAQMLNNPFFDLLGRYSYSIYVMQQTAFYMLMRSLWKNKDWMAAHPFVSFAVSALFTIVIGIATFHLVERPATKWFSAWKRRRFAVPAAPAAGT